MGSSRHGKTYQKILQISFSKRIFKTGFNLLKEVVLVFLSQRAAKLWFVKHWGWSHCPEFELRKLPSGVWWAKQEYFVRFICLTACSFSALWSEQTHNTSLERSRSQCQHIFWTRDCHYFWNRSSQTDLIIIVFSLLGVWY